MVRKARIRLSSTDHKKLDGWRTVVVPAKKQRRI